MRKGQSTEQKVKKMLKFFKLNESAISTVMGGVVMIVIAGLIFNYFRTSNLKTWQGSLVAEETPAMTSDGGTNQDKNIATYKVVKGDDLWHIAERFYKSGYNYVDIMSENKLDKSGVIYAGMELRIPKVEAKKITVADSGKGFVVKQGNIEQKVAKAAANTIDVGEYMTQKGDTYWNIAVRAYGDGFKWTKVYWVNRAIFANPDLIHAGVKINIPMLGE